MAFDDPTLGAMDFFRSLRESAPDVVTDMFRLISEPAFYIYTPIAIAAWLLWFRNRRAGDMLMVNLLTSVCLNRFVKYMVAQPRPWVQEGLSYDLSGTHSGGYSFPSGHVSASVAGYGTLALVFRKGWMTAICLSAIVLIAFSRLYLGVHTPLDVVGAAVLATGVICLNGRLLSISERSDSDFRKVSYAYIAVFTVLAIVTVTVGDGISSNGILGIALFAGYFVGRHIEHLRLRTQVPSFDNGTQFLFVMIGLMPAGILLLALPYLFGHSVGYAIAGTFTGLWVSLLYPMVLDRIQ